MIIATFKPDGFWVKGHAEYAEIGSDIVCAAVSSLVTHTVRLMAQQGYQYELTEDVTGLAAVMVLVTPFGALNVMSALMDSLNDIAAQYPENIEVHDFTRKEEDNE